VADHGFYIGYEPKAPADVASWVRISVVLLFVVLIVVAVTASTQQERFDPGFFEWGTVRDFRGVVEERPYPALYVERRGTSPRGAGFSRLDLVAVGKIGAASAVEGLDGQVVDVRGTLIYYQGRTMIELAGDGVTASEDDALVGRFAASQRVPEDLGEQTLTGEIVDSKCFLGVMKPGRSKPHRACATRCIGGGIPPVLLVENVAGDTELFLLVGADGRAINQEVLPYVAEPIVITGRVRRQGKFLVLESEPANYRRPKRGQVSHFDTRSCVFVYCRNVRPDPSWLRSTIRSWMKAARISLPNSL